MWKKEISFGRKKKHASDEPVAALPDAVADASGDVQGPDLEPGPEETEPEEQVWTRAVSFGRKSAEQSMPEPVADPEPVSEETVPVEAVADVADVVTDGSAEVQGSDPEPGPEQTAPVLVEAVADVPEVVADGSADVQGSDPEPRPEETAPEEPVWTKAVSF